MAQNLQMAGKKEAKLPVNINIPFLKMHIGPLLPSWVCICFVGFSGGSGVVEFASEANIRL